MNKYLKLLLRPFDRGAFERKVDQELRFHLEMQAHDYERQGMGPEESASKAAQRFGDFAKVKEQCVRIASQDSWVVQITRIIFALTFILGVMVRVLSPELHVTRVGNLLMMIGGLGWLLLHLKRLAASRLQADEEPVQLGLGIKSDSPPPGFDEKGRTPFDRVRAD